MIKKQLLLLIILISSYAGYSQTVTPQWKAGTGYILNYYPGKSPSGYDTLAYLATHRLLFKLKADSVNSSGYVTNSNFNLHGIKFTDTIGRIATQYYVEHAPHTWYGSQLFKGNLEVQGALFYVRPLSGTNPYVYADNSTINAINGAGTSTILLNGNSTTLQYNIGSLIGTLHADNITGSRVWQLPDRNDTLATKDMISEAISGNANNSIKNQSDDSIDSTQTASMNINGAAVFYQGAGSSYKKATLNAGNLEIRNNTGAQQSLNMQESLIDFSDSAFVKHTFRLSHFAGDDSVRITGTLPLSITQELLSKRTPTNQYGVARLKEILALQKKIVVDIRDFGAIADYNPVTDTYTTDNTGAIQAAINSLPNGAGTVYIPNGIGFGYAFTGTIYRGQGTRFLGDNSGFSTQSNPTDTIRYKVASLLRYKGTGTALAQQTTANYRNQFAVDENYALIGNGKGSAANGIIYNSNPSYITTNPNSQDIGLIKVNHIFIDGFTTGIDFKRSDTYYLQDSHISTTRTAIRGGKQDGYIFNNCFFSNDTAMYNHAGLALDVHNNEVEPGSGTNGIGFVADSNNFSSFHDNKYKNFKTAVIIQNNGSSNSIVNETLNAATGDAVIINTAGDNNRVTNLHAKFTTGRVIYARQTNKLLIAGGMYGSPISATVPAVQIDTCTSVTYSGAFDNDYANGYKLSATGSVSLDQSDYANRRVWGNSGFNGTPGYAVRYGSAATPVGSGVITATFKSEVSNGTSYAQTANIEAQTTETQSVSAGGSRLNFNVTPTGSTTRTTRAYIDGNGLRLVGATNSADLIPGTAGTADNLQFKAVNTNKNMQFTLVPSGTATGDKIVLQNSSATSNFGTVYFGASADSAFVSYQDNGTAATPLRHLNIGTSGALGGGNWTTVNIRATNSLNLPSVTRVPYTGVLKGNGSASNISTAVPNTDYLPVTSPVMVTPTLGAATATSLAITGTRIGNATLVAGTVAISISGVTTSSRAFVTRTAASNSSLTQGLTAVCTSGTLTITADVAAGTINTADTSSYNYFVIN